MLPGRRAITIALFISTLTLLGAAVLKPSQSASGQTTENSIPPSNSIYQPLIVRPPGVQASPPLINSSMGAPTSAPAGVLPCVSIPDLTDKCPTWTTTFDGPGQGAEGQGGFAANGRVTATGPDGRVVYVAAMTDAGAKSNGQRQFDIVVVA